MGNPNPTGARHQSKVSPLKRIRLARGLSMQEVSVYSGVAYGVVQKLDRLEPGKIGSVTLSKLMKVAITLECSPVDLVPFLATRVKGKGKEIVRKTASGKDTRFRIGEGRSMNPAGGWGRSEV